MEESKGDVEINKLQGQWNGFYKMDIPDADLNFDARTGPRVKPPDEDGAKSQELASHPGSGTSLPASLGLSFPIRVMDRVRAQPAGSRGPNPAPPGPRPAPGAPPGATQRAPAPLARVLASVPDSAHQANLREKGGGGEGRVEPTAGRCGDFAGVLRAGCRGPALSATEPFGLNAPSERAGLLFIPTQFYRGTQFTPTLPMGKPRLGKELYPKPPTYHPTGPGRCPSLAEPTEKPEELLWSGHAINTPISWIMKQAQSGIFKAAERS
ncbi:translation initiation factor IF-2-like [Ursus arctos]|uniref:translation initiation factor IF-2-like n=1 Tax=Ursus arctos TaxID=9644 RepID=UPI002547331A|nr:translation initiation factor IF-2-like [Ursus arctos]